MKAHPTYSGCGLQPDRHELLDENADEEGIVSVGETQEDVIRAVLVGTFRVLDGDVANVFKRGADSFPQVDRECFLISAGNLQRFMNLLSANVTEGERLQLGQYVSDGNAVAVANGDKFFQRHAAILGSTGSGKSWCTALILERASKLAHPNLIVLDMHGEYSPLANERRDTLRSTALQGRETWKSRRIRRCSYRIGCSIEKKCSP